MKLLIVSADAGAGHMRAAQALEEHAREAYPRAEVRNVDILSFTDPVFRRAYAGSWLKLATRMPALWGYLYSTSDAAKARHKRARIARVFERWEFSSFRAMVKDFAPDAALFTHFLPAQTLAPYRDKPWCRFRIGVVMTDLDPHVFWAQPMADHFFVGSQEALESLADKDIPRAKVTFTGIPIVSAFASAPTREEARARLGLAAELPVLLVMGGGAGIGFQDEIVREAVACARVQVLAVSGRNEKLRERIAAVPVPAGSVVRALGFVNNMHELMAAADLAVTKSGGLTTSECLAMGLPMLVPDPIPGQEDRNADYVVEIGAGWKARGPGSLRYKLRLLLNDRPLLERMSARARLLGRPRAASQVLSIVPGA